MKKICIVLSMCMMFVLGACCVQEVEAEQDKPIKLWGQNKSGSYYTLVVVDDSTGVNYVAVATSRGSYGEQAIAVTPRFNADGTLYVTGGK